MGASFAVGPHSTSASTFLLRVWSGYPSAARPFPTCCHPLHLRLPSAFAQVASVRMPSGARSPWAAADPCFHTGSRRYPSIRPMALVCAGHRPHSALSRLLLAAFASGLKSRSWALPSLRGIAPEHAFTCLDALLRGRVERRSSLARRSSAPVAGQGPCRTSRASKKCRLTLRFRS